MATVLISIPDLSSTAIGVIGRAASRLRAISAGLRAARQLAELREGDSGFRDLPDHLLRDIGFVRQTAVRIPPTFPYL